jgi:hypothetical protein
MSQSVCNVKLVANGAREAWGAFYSPQENLAVGVSETRTCPGRGPNMSGHCLWNPAAKPDKTVWPDNAERPNMSGLGAGHVQPESLESG